MKQIFYVSICTHVFFLAVLEEGNSAPSEPNPFSAKGRRASFLWMFIARVDVSHTSFKLVCAVLELWLHNSGM